MSFFKPMDEHDLDHEGYSDGQNKTLPDEYETTCVITGGFCGIEDGQAQQVLFLNLAITEQGEFCGQAYKYTSKIYNMDATKRDRAMTHLGVIDAQAGFPMTNGKLDPTTENINDYWVGVAEVKVKFGLIVQTEDREGNKLLDENGLEVVRYMNFVRGFAYDREKMRKPGQPTQQQQVADGPAYADQVPAQQQAALGNPKNQAEADKASAQTTRPSTAAMYDPDGFALEYDEKGELLIDF